MDSPIVAQLFRQLFAHRPCRSHSSLPFRIDNGRRPQARCFSSQRPRAKNGNDSHWQQRTDIFPRDMSEEYTRYPMVTADELRGRRERPRRVKMLTRDFIEGMRKIKLPLDQAHISQTLCIIRRMATSLNRWSFSLQESNLISIASKTSPSSTASWASGTQNLRTS
jgi:hypothetical protein